MGLLSPDEVAAAVLELVRDDAVAQERVVGGLPAVPEGA